MNAKLEGVIMKIKYMRQNILSKESRGQVIHRADMCSVADRENATGLEVKLS